MGLVLTFSSESTAMTALFVAWITSIITLWTLMIVVLAVTFWFFHSLALQFLVEYLDSVSRLFIKRYLNIFSDFPPFVFSSGILHSSRLGPVSSSPHPRGI